MTIPIYQVDAFTDQPFRGNPAAVCILNNPRDVQWMQQVAAENNLSETAFLERLQHGFGLRWFTPAVEVALCGHATLASAHILWTEGMVKDGSPISFHSLSGELIASQQAGFIELDFPSKPQEPSEPAHGLLESLGIEAPAYVGRNQFDYIVEVPSAAAVRSLQPDFVELRKIQARGVIVTAVSDQPEFDFISRYFAPGAGIDEDPVTGSAHCCSGPYWQKRLAGQRQVRRFPQHVEAGIQMLAQDVVLFAELGAVQLGKSELIAYQASARGGIVRVRVIGDRTFLGGAARTVLKGTLLC